MAVDWKKYGIDATRNSSYGMWPEDLEPHPDLNGRAELPDTAELEESIERIGQIQPIGIRRDGDKAYIFAGVSRWRAMCNLNKRNPPEKRRRIECVTFTGTAQEAFELTIAENKVRNASTPMDDAHNIRILKSWGKTTEEIAKIYGEKQQWVDDRLALLQLTEGAREAVKSGKLKTAAAKQLAKMSEAKQAEVIASGATTAAAIKAVTQPDRPKKMGIADVVELLKSIHENGANPMDFDRAKWDAVDEFCGWLLGKVKGE